MNLFNFFKSLAICPVCKRMNWNQEIRGKAITALKPFGVSKRDISKAVRDGRDRVIDTVLNGLPIALRLNEGIFHGVAIRDTDGKQLDEAVVLGLIDKGLGELSAQMSFDLRSKGYYDSWDQQLPTLYFFAPQIVDIFETTSFEERREAYDDMYVHIEKFTISLWEKLEESLE